MKKCSECGGEMIGLSDKTPEGVLYHYFKCKKCGDEVLGMDQLHTVAKKYREMKRFSAKISKWGMSLGVRIPKELAEKYHFKDNGEVIMIPEKEGIRIVAV